MSFSSVQLLSRVQFFVTPWTAARQASLSNANSWSLLKLMSIESVMPSNHHPLSSSPLTFQLYQTSCCSSSRQDTFTSLCSFCSLCLHSFSFLECWGNSCLSFKTLFCETFSDATPILVQFSSVAQLCPTLCNPMDCSTPGFPVHHQLPELAQTHVYRVGDAIQRSHPLLSPSPPAFNLSQDQGLFQWASSSHQVAKVLEFQLQLQSFQWIFRTDFLQDGLVGSLCSPRDSQESSPTLFGVWLSL